ncbi:MAG: hypothetical protein V4760_17155 [Bdellovibrionota bacterium]
MNRRIDDDQIAAFLKKHQPVAPAIDEAKVQASALAKLGLTSNASPGRVFRRPMPWIAFSGAMAAGLAALFIVTKNVDVPPGSAVSAAVVEADSDWDEDPFEDEELPTMEIGEDYLEMMAMNDSTGRVTK